jgi:hypothetical protein
VTGAFGTCGKETTPHERTQGSAGVSGPSDAERDACEVVQALAGLAALLAQPACDRGDPAIADARRTLVRLAESGGEAAVRVLGFCVRSVARAMARRSRCRRVSASGGTGCRRAATCSAGPVPNAGLEKCSHAGVIRASSPHRSRNVSDGLVPNRLR